jgi:hypothetical protein
VHSLHSITLGPPRSTLKNSYNSSTSQSLHEEPSSAAISPLPTPSTDVLTCEMCGTKFTGAHMKGNLARHHKARHTAPQGLLCRGQDCLRSFRRQDSRLKHERTCHRELNRDAPRRRR